MLHQQGIFVLCKDGNDFAANLFIISTFCLIKCNTTFEFMHNIVCHLFMFLRQDADTFSSGKTTDKLIQHDTVKVGTQYTDHQCFGVINQDGACNSQDTDNRNSLAQLNMQIFVQNLRQNIQSTGRSVCIKHQ